VYRKLWSIHRAHGVGFQRQQGVGATRSHLSYTSLVCTKDSNIRASRPCEPWSKSVVCMTAVQWFCHADPLEKVISPILSADLFDHARSPSLSHRSISLAQLRTPVVMRLVVSLSDS
jgi:hypothetical protein